MPIGCHFSFISWVKTGGFRVHKVEGHKQLVFLIWEKSALADRPDAPMIAAQTPFCADNVRKTPIFPERTPSNADRIEDQELSVVSRRTKAVDGGV
jgi:hypothetical protein